MTITLAPMTTASDPGSDDICYLPREEAPAPIFVVPDFFQAGGRNSFVDVTKTSFLQVIWALERLEGCPIEYELNGNRICIIVTGLRLVPLDSGRGRVEIVYGGVEATTGYSYEIFYRGKHPYQLRLTKRAQHAESVQEVAA